MRFKAKTEKVGGSTVCPQNSGAEMALYRDFIIEKDAKNRAYAFILSSGLFKQFGEYCATHTGDPFEDCLDSVAEMAKEEVIL